MKQAVSGTILVGHGGVPKDCPHDLVMRLKRLEAQRRESGAAPSAEELELDAKIRLWPRTAGNDPYKAGLEALASQLRPLLGESLFALAYNEFCAPTVAEAAEELITSGAQRITVLSSMFTPGGSHAEIEIPEAIERLKAAHPRITFRYAWPFDLQLVATMLATQIKRHA